MIDEKNRGRKQQKTQIFEVVENLCKSRMCLKPGYMMRAVETRRNRIILQLVVTVGASHSSSALPHPDPCWSAISRVQKMKQGRRVG